MDVDIRKTTEEDIRAIAKNIREAERVEISALLGVSPLAGLFWSFKMTKDTYSVFAKDGTILCVWGFKRDSWCSHEIWMITTKAVEELKYAKVFIKTSKIIIADIISQYENPHNIIHDKNTASIKWLKMLGADFNGDIIVKGEKFLKFKFKGSELTCVQ